jgi:hypothetical protein
MGAGAPFEPVRDSRQDSPPIYRVGSTIERALTGLVSTQAASNGSPGGLYVNGLMADGRRELSWRAPSL